MTPPISGPPAAFVAGEPVLLLSRSEAAWREAVRCCGVTSLTDVRLRFVVRSWHRGGNRFDLDNLVDPVLAVVAAPVPLRRSIWATVETVPPDAIFTDPGGEEPGVEISASAPPPAPANATTVHLPSAPHRSVRTAERLAELADHVPIGSDEACGCALTLGPTCRASSSDSEVRSSPTHAPADHRIRDLRVTPDERNAGVLVSLWPLAEP